MAKAQTKRLVFLSVSAVLVFLFLFQYCAYAFRMNTDSPRVEMSVDPGKGQSGYISIFNYDEEETIRVKAYINDLIYLPDGSNDFLPAGVTPWSVADWLKIAPTEFNIPPKGEAKVRYRTDVPKGVEGGRYGVVFFETSPSLKELKDKTGATINVRIGSIFLITVKGTERYNTELEDLAVGKPDENGVFEISCNIKNNGNVIIRPNGPVKIIDSSKSEIAELKLNEEKSGVLPGTSRQFSVKYDKGKIAPGEYFAQVVLDYGGETLLGGQVAFNVNLAK